MKKVKAFTEPLILLVWRACLGLHFGVCKLDRFPVEAYNQENMSVQYILAEAVLTSTHNLCFGAKIRKIGIPLHTPVLLYKSGV